jgi:hypothetical protein
VTWTYTLPITTDKDAVRFEVGDTNEDYQFLQDEEIDSLLTTEGDVTSASIVAAERIAAKLARGFNQKVGDLSADLSKQADAYWKLADKLRKQLAIKSGAPLAPALSIAAKQAYTEDTDRVQPEFTIGMNDDDSSADTSDTT